MKIILSTFLILLAFSSHSQKKDKVKDYVEVKREALKDNKLSGFFPNLPIDCKNYSYEIVGNVDGNVKTSEGAGIEFNASAIEIINKTAANKFIYLDVKASCDKTISKTGKFKIVD